MSLDRHAGCRFGTCTAFRLRTLINIGVYFFFDRRFTARFATGSWYQPVRARDRREGISKESDCSIGVITDFWILVQTQIVNRIHQTFEAIFAKLPDVSGCSRAMSGQRREWLCRVQCRDWCSRLRHSRSPRGGPLGNEYHWFQNRPQPRQESSRNPCRLSLLALAINASASGSCVPDYSDCWSDLQASYSIKNNNFNCRSFGI